jgi:hypothetical protein
LLTSSRDGLAICRGVRDSFTPVRTRAATTGLRRFCGLLTATAFRGQRIRAHRLVTAGPQRIPAPFLPDQGPIPISAAMTV